MVLAGNGILAVTSENTCCPPASLSESRAEQGLTKDRSLRSHDFIVSWTTAIKFYSNTYLHIGRKLVAIIQSYSQLKPLNSVSGLKILV